MLVECLEDFESNWISAYIINRITLTLHINRIFPYQFQA